jgi:hypothetical protein
VPAPAPTQKPAGLHHCRPIRHSRTIPEHAGALLLESGGLRAQILYFLYLPENHGREFSVRQITAGINHPNYDSEKERDNATVRSFLSKLLKAEVTASRLDNRGITGNFGYHRALTEDEIDDKSIKERVDHYRAKHQNLDSDILRHMYDNPDRQFSAEILAHEFPGKAPENPAAVTNYLQKRKGTMAWLLNDLKSFGLIEVVVPGERGGTAGQYRAFR